MIENFGNYLFEHCMLLSSLVLFYPGDPDDVIKIIDSLPNKKSVRIDEIPIRLIR